MRKHTAHKGFMLEIAEGTNNWEVHNFQGFSAMLDSFENELDNVLDPKFKAVAYAQIKTGTSFWALGTSESKDCGYLVTAGNVSYFFSHSS